MLLSEDMNLLSSCKAVHFVRALTILISFQEVVLNSVEAKIETMSKKNVCISKEPVCPINQCCSSSICKQEGGNYKCCDMPDSYSREKLSDFVTTKEGWGCSLCPKCCCERFELSSNDPSHNIQLSRFGAYSRRASLATVNDHWVYEHESSDGSIMFHSKHGWRAYADVPQNPDNISSDQVRFKCKSNCITECYKERKRKIPKYYDGRDPGNEWLQDPSITLTCLDESRNNKTASLHLPDTDLVSVTENCPGTVSVPDFNISSPISGYGGRMSCNWNLTNHIGTRITLDFTEFYISNNDNNQPCTSNYVELSDGTSSIKFCHSSNVPKEFLSDGNFVSIKFYSRQFRDWRKFTVKYKSVTNEPRSAYPQSGCNIKNRGCVPKCSELTQEEMTQGLQCEMDVDLPFENNKPQKASVEESNGSTKQRDNLIGLILFVSGFVILFIGVIALVCLARMY